MRGLDSPKATLTEGKKAKPDFLDLNKNGNKTEPMKKAAKEKSKGAIAEAVARVEQHLAEKYMGFKKAADKKMTEGEQQMSRAAKGHEKYGKEGMEALAKAGREGKDLDKVRNKYNKYKDDVNEAAGAIDYEKVLEAIAALYGDDMWENDAMGDLAQDLEQANPTDRELDFIIAKGKLPTRLKGIRFTNTDDVQFGHLGEGDYNEDMLSPGQKKIAKMSPPPGKIDANDLAALRAGKKKKAEGNAFSGALDAAKKSGQEKFSVDGKEYQVQEGWDEMMADVKQRSGPQPSGGSGIKAGKRYGGSAQKDEPETDNETGEVAKKGRGRPKKDKFAK